MLDVLGNVWLSIAELQRPVLSSRRRLDPMKRIDLRSDTVTPPTPAMRAMTHYGIARRDIDRVLEVIRRVRGAWS